MAVRPVVFVMVVFEHRLRIGGGDLAHPIHRRLHFLPQPLPDPLRFLVEDPSERGSLRNRSIGSLSFHFSRSSSLR
jgi:hypothetical protein